MTVTTDDEDIRRAFEPFCPSNAVRLHAISEVQTEDVDSCITMTPLLWLNEPYAFADHLLETNVEKFIVQPFHFQRGKFVAGTRKAAVDMMIEKLGCDEASFRERYIEDYERSLGALDRALPELGQGKDGFRAALLTRENGFSAPQVSQPNALPFTHPQPLNPRRR